MGQKNQGKKESFVYYGRGGGRLGFEIPAKWNVLTQFEPAESPAVPDVLQEARRALDNPIGTPRIEEMAKPGKAVILFDDLNRQTPSHLAFPEILNRLNAAGIKDGDITAICAVGSHPVVDEDGFKLKLGEEAYKRLSPRVMNHDCTSEENVIIGRTSRGCLVEINPFVYQAEFVVGIGSAMPHLMSGFGGGTKIIMPGISSFQAILEHHTKWLANPKARLGLLEGNYCLEEQNEHSMMAGFHFKLDFAMNVRDEVFKAYAGDPIQVTRAAGKDLIREYGSHVPRRADVVITGTYPMDRGVQALKGLFPAVLAAKTGGHIIMVGRQSLFQQFIPLVPELNSRKTSAQETRLLMQGEVNPIAKVAGVSAWLSVVGIKSIKERFKVTYVSEDLSRSDVESIGFDYAASVEEALKRIDRDMPEADVIVYPAGSITIPILG
ncbi:MAG: lactate racemase domain-containing protein [Pseudomonadota bacterium]